MASSSGSGRQERGYHQDYIARTRYQNPLPPPSNPPKLLDIPGTGLSSGQYTSPAFASRMAREQPLNIEADAELGMPLDLVGMPGIFDGDESSIQAPDQTPVPHPKDKALLRPLSALGKPSSVGSNVSFLRRTEYISAEQSRSRFEPSATPKHAKPAGEDVKKKRRAEAARDDPINILRTVVKGFDVANPDHVYKGPDTGTNFRGHPPTPDEVDAWSRPQHPTKKGLHVVESYPILPDLDAMPDAGGYMVMKFGTNPMAATETYDERLDVGIFKPMETSREDAAANHQAAVAAHQLDPKKPHPGPPPFDYEYFIPQDAKSVTKIQSKFNVNDPSRDDAELYDNTNKATGEKSFRYSRLRAYETATAQGGQGNNFNEVAIALYDPEQDNTGDSSKPNKQRGAYFYPIIQKATVRPRRAANMAQMGRMNNPRQAELDAEKLDYLDIIVRDPDETEAARRMDYKKQYDPSSGEGAEDGDAEVVEEAEGGGDTAVVTEQMDKLDT
ncbi:MAG: hypothetical protein M1817_002840 [Caeruleum heppii]|nr:MAG: hypothetical protein M1817_002840 [Caeruleum heppii]